MQNKVIKISFKINPLKSGCSVLCNIIGNKDVLIYQKYLKNQKYWLSYFLQCMVINRYAR